MGRDAPPDEAAAQRGDGQEARVEGLDWALIALGLFADFGSTGGGMFGRDRGRKWRER